MSKFYARMQQRRGTAAEWTAANPILQAGEIGYETDTEQFKIGNGTDTWSALEYWEGALPDQTSNSGKFLTTDGTDAAWADVDTFPSQSGNSGYFLTTDGTAVAWAEVDALPTQTGNTGYYLKTDGTTASWDELSIDDLVAVSLDDIDGVTITGTPGEGQSLIYDSSTSSVDKRRVWWKCFGKRHSPGRSRQRRYVVELRRCSSLCLLRRCRC